MVVANSGWIQNVNYCSTKNDSNLNVNVDSNKMSAKAILICRDNSHAFQDRTLNLDQAVKIGRSVARTRAAADNAIFDCKVLSRNHALLVYNAGKFYLRDTRSSNGTFINNVRLSATGSESAAKEVCSGDIVQFGVDVIESTKKVTHGCIIATLKLYLPDGKEAKASTAAYITSPAGDVTLEDLYKLNQYVQEANRREKVLHSKLVYLQKLVENTKKAASQSWKALIDEDRLLSRVKTVESQLVIYSKNFSEDKLRDETIKLEEEKSRYQIAAKEALQRVHQEKLEVTQKLIQLESRLNETEEECQSLHEISKHAQVELQQLAVKYTNAQKNLAQFEEKLAEQEQSSSKIVEWAVQEKQDLMKKVRQQTKMGYELQCKLNENRWDAVKIHKKLTGLKNYMQTLQDINTKLLADESKDGVNPMEAINAIFDTLNEIIEYNIYDLQQFENVDYVENIFGIEDNQSKLHGDDSNLKIVPRADRRSSYDKNELDESNNDCDNFAAYILPPSNPRRKCINGKVNVDEHNQEQDSNSEIGDDTSCANSDGDTHSLVSNEDNVENSVIENKLEAESSTTNSFVHSEDAGKYEVTFTDNVNDQQPQIHYHRSSDMNNSADSDDSSNSTDSPNELTISSQNHNTSTINQNKNDDADNEFFQNDEITQEKNDGVKLKMEDKKKERNLEKEFRDRRNTKEKNKDNKADDKNTDHNCTIESMEKEEKSDNNESEENDESDETKEDCGYIKTLKSFDKNKDNFGQYPNIKDYILQLFMNSLESLNRDDDIEAQHFVMQELDELRNWLVHENNDIVIEKLKASYYQVKNNNNRVQEMSEELVILKEKYSACHEEKTDVCKKYTILKAQCGDVMNASYSVPIQYFVPVAIAFLWMLFEHIF